MTQTENIDDIVRKLCSMEAPLGERLSVISAVVREHEAPFAEAYDELANRLAQAKAFSAAPDSGDVFPPFALEDAHGIVHTLEEFLSKGPLVVSFNRGHWCPYCMVELSALKQGLSRIAAAGAQVVSIMPDRHEYVAKASAEVGDAFVILSDENNGFALSLDLVMWLGTRIKALSNGVEIELEKSQKNGARFVPIPATFVVGTGGRINKRFLDPDFRKRMEIDDIVDALKIAEA
jgi:peroxiredoxin